MASLSRPLKRLVRPLVPERILRRFRPAALPGGAVNIDVVVTGTDAAAWEAQTPDTVRTVDPGRYGEPAEVPGARHPASPDFGASGPVLIEARPIGPDRRRALLAPLTDPAIGAAIVGAATPAGLSTGATPVIEPHAIAVARPGDEHQLEILIRLNQRVDQAQGRFRRYVPV